jgi:hypothetical protein
MIEGGYLVCLVIGMIIGFFAGVVVGAASASVLRGGRDAPAPTSERPRRKYYDEQ